jgi:predicted dehydrogenase
MADGNKPLRFGVAGSGNRSQSYAHILAQLEGARVAAVAAGNRVAVDLQQAIPGLAVDRDVSALIRRPGIDAIVFADPVADLAAVIRRALLADKHVLATVSSPLTCRQFEELAALARRHSRLLMFTEERSFQPGLTFLKWMLSGGRTLWQPRYIRAVSASGIGNGSVLSVSMLVFEELALCARLLGENPSSISGMACIVGTEGSPAAAFINMLYADGKAASLQVSATEAQETRQWALATSSRTVFLDECDVRSPLRIISSDSEAMPGALLRVNPPVPLAQWPTESTVTPPLQSTDVKLDQCRHFMESALKQDLGEGNAPFWAEVALVWEAAQESMRLSGMPADVNLALESERRVVGERPQLRLIRGKGTGAVDARKRPALTLVPR